MKQITHTKLIDYLITIGWTIVRNERLKGYTEVKKKFDDEEKDFNLFIPNNPNFRDYEYSLDKRIESIAMMEDIDKKQMIRKIGDVK